MQSIPYYPIGGVNLLVDPLRIADNEAQALKNLYPSLSGKLEKRKGVAYYDWVDDAQFGFNPENLEITNFNVPASLANSFIATLNELGSQNAYIVINQNNRGPSRTLATYTRPTSGRPVILNFGNYTLISTGAGVQGGVHDTFGCIYVVWHDNATGRLEFLPNTGEASILPYGPVFKDSTGKNFAPSVMARYRQRIVYAGFEAPYENYLIFTDSGTFNIIEDTTAPLGANGVILNNSARTITIPGLRGDRITALVETAASGVSNALQSQLLILSENSAYIMYGEPIQTNNLITEPLPFSVVKAQYECGCASAETVVRTPSGLLWANWNDVWAMEWGGVPHRVGTKIRPALMAGQPTFRNRWHAVYNHADGSYRLAVPAPGQDEGPSLPLQHQWWLDVRSGLPRSSDEARWFGPHTYRVACEAATSGVQGTHIMRAVERPGDFPVILAPYIAAHPDSLTSNRSLVIAAMDKQTGYDSARPLYRPSDGLFLDNLYSELDNEIAFEIISKRFDLGDGAVDKIYEGIEFTVWMSDITAFGCEVMVDGGRMVDEEYIVPPQTGFVIDVDALDDKRETHEYQAVAIQPDQDERFTGKNFQLRIFDKPGVALPKEGLGYEFIVSRGSTYYVLDARYMGLDFFPDIWAFASDLAAVLQANIGGVFTSVIVSNKVRLKDMTATNWAWHGYAGPSDYQRSSRKVGAIIGFLSNLPNTWLGSNGSSEAVTGNVSVRRKPCAHVEIADMFIRVSGFSRRPAGGRYESSIP